MNDALVQAVRRRANHACEYCLLPRDLHIWPFEIDHVIALQHGGPTVLSNLALACFHGNSHKGSDIASLDPTMRKLVPLFNPRRHKWGRHFRWEGPRIVGRTPIGRATVRLLVMNDPERLALRAEVIADGLFPPA